MSAISSGSEDRPQKRMRKGTRSCQECRRRKVRCVYEPNAHVCNGCRPRGTDCVEQEFDEARIQASTKRRNMRDRVGELEGMIGQILHKLDANGAGNRGILELDAANALRSLQSELMPSTFVASYASSPQSSNKASSQHDLVESAMSPQNLFKNAPLLSLFDNAILAPDVPVSDEPVKGRQPVKHKATEALKALQALAPSPNDLNLVCQGIEYILPLLWRAMPEALDGLSTTAGVPGYKDLQEYMLQSLSSTNPLTVARILLCLAYLMLMLPGTFDYSKTNLPRTPEGIETRFVQPVETLLAADEGLASSGIDAVICMMLQSKFNLNIGKPGKSWLANRRAMSFGQLVGLHHRPTGHTVDKQLARKRGLWAALWLHDRMFSLVLGLPYSVPESHFGLEDIEAESREGIPALAFTFRVRLGLVSGRIVDRNLCPRNMTFAKTLEIEQELDACKEIMPPEWWDRSPSLSDSLLDTFEMSISKFWYHNVRKLLHLPFMLKSFTDRVKYAYSKVAAVESAREMVKCYRIFRDKNRPMFGICDIVDFEAFGAGVIILLHLYAAAPATDTSEETRDWDIIDGLISDMRLVSGSVATQATRVLEDMSRARYFYNDIKQECLDCPYEAIIPYFGKLRLRAGKHFDKCKTVVATPDSGTQLLTPADSLSSTGSEGYKEPVVSFDTYFQPLPQSDDMQYLQGVGTDWTSMVNMDLRDDWSWFLNGNAGDTTGYMS